jgi:hypothetical protein
MKLRQDISIYDLVSITSFLHRVKPSLKEYFCTGLELPKPEDKNVIFHISDGNEDCIVMLSAEYIVERYE